MLLCVFAISTSLEATAHPFISKDFRKENKIEHLRFLRLIYIVMKMQRFCVRLDHLVTKEFYQLASLLRKCENIEKYSSGHTGS